MSSGQGMISRSSMGYEPPGTPSSRMEARSQTMMKRERQNRR
jgi:hypothetical protein